MFQFQQACFRSIQIRTTIIAALLTAFLLACPLAAVRAQDPEPTFDVKLNRDLAALNGSTSVFNHSGAFIDAQNNRPYIQVTNLVDTPLTTFEMTVADGDLFHFAELPQGLINVVEKPSDVTVTPTFLLDGDKLKIDFGPGLDKDEFVQFQIRLGADNCPSCGPSYQVALYNICHDEVPMGPSGTVSANGGEPTNWNVDYTTHYVDGYYAPVFTSSILNPPVTESAGSDKPFVPEPSGLLLALFGLCGMAQSCGARRRRARA